MSRRFKISLLSGFGFLLVISFQNFDFIGNKVPQPLPQKLMRAVNCNEPTLSLANPSEEELVSFASCRMLGTPSFTGFPQVVEKLKNGRINRRGIFVAIFDLPSFDTKRAKQPNLDQIADNGKFLDELYAQFFPSGVRPPQYAKDVRFMKRPPLPETTELTDPDFMGDAKEKRFSPSELMKRKVLVNLLDTQEFRKMHPYLESAPTEVFSDVESFITDLSVIEDEALTSGCGEFTFCYLMRNAFQGKDAAVEVEKMLAHFDSVQVVNGFTVKPRPNIQKFLKYWPRDAAGKLDLTKAPFRLLGIVNRTDLRDPNGSDAGEGRFIFGMTIPKDGKTPREYVRLQFVTVIFEYKLLFNTAVGLNFDAWVRSWHRLANYVPGSVKYNRVLANIARHFTTWRFAGKPNGSALSQFRTSDFQPFTNESFFDDWEFREFRLNDSGSLVQTTVADTPDRKIFNESETLKNFILSGQKTVPKEFEGKPFLAGSSLQTNLFCGIPPCKTPFTDTWTMANFPEITQDALHEFNLITCSGCHGTATQSSQNGMAENSFHLEPRILGKAPKLSGFLTGTTGLIAGKMRSFNILKDRAEDFRSLLDQAVNAPAVVKEDPRLGELATDVNVTFKKSKLKRRVH